MDNMDSEVKKSPRVVFSTNQQAQLKILEDNHLRRKELSDRTGIPYSLVDMDIIKMAIMLGIIKNKAVLEGKETDNSSTFLDVLMGGGGASSDTSTESVVAIPFYYKPFPHAVTNDVKMDYEKKKIQNIFKTLLAIEGKYMVESVQHLQSRVFIKVNKFDMNEHVKTCINTLNMLIMSLEDETHKQDIVDILTTISMVRLTLFPPLGMAKYSSLLTDHLDKLKQLRINTKLVCASLSWVDNFITGRCRQLMECVPLSLKPLLEQELLFRRYEHSKVLTSFHITDIVTRCCVPSLLVLPVETILSLCFIGVYGNNPIVYVPFKGRIDPEPWSFYILKEDVGMHRIWVIDHYLIKTTEEIRKHLIYYIIEMFTKLYSRKPMFKPIMCENKLFKCLMRNLLFVYDLHQFRSFVSRLVVEQSAYIPVTYDLVNSQQPMTMAILNTLHHPTIMSKLKMIKSLFSNSAQFTFKHLEDLTRG